MNDAQSIKWSPRVKPELIVRLYKAHASGIADDELIDDVGFALLARCETIYRVTERLCPECGGVLDGAWDDERSRDRILTCMDCQWQSTWDVYRHSYKRDRIHGGRAYEYFTRYLAEFPKCKTPQAKMMCIDRLIHSVHESMDRAWTKPGAENLIQGKSDDVKEVLDRLAYGDTPTEAQREFRRKIAESVEPTLRREQELNNRLQKSADSSATDSRS